MKDHTISYLVEKLKEAQIMNPQTIAGGKQTLYAWMRKGFLTPRRMPHNNWPIFNDEEIAEIIEAFSPGGPGYWNYEESKAA
jgi:hypothetical protein